MINVGKYSSTMEHMGQFLQENGPVEIVDD